MGLRSRSGRGRSHCWRRPSVTRLLVAGLVGLVPIYGIGAAWLALQLHLNRSTAIVTGVAPFLVGDVLKAIAAALAARSLVSLPLGLPALQRDL